MSRLLRWLLAAACIAVWFVLPAPDRAELAALDLRAWIDPADRPGDSPLWPQIDSAHRIPALGVAWLVAGGEPTPRNIREADCARWLREWARRAGCEVDPGRPPLGLEVRVGDNGHLARLFDAQGAEIAHRQVLREEVAGVVSDGVLPGPHSLLPALVAVLLAALTRRVVPALLAGAFAGALVFRGYDPFAGAAHLVEHTFLRIVGDPFNQQVMGFVVFLFMAVGVMARSGAIQGMVEWLQRYARGPVSTQVCAWIAGVLVFFDDYSNCILVGTTMRPLCDRNRVSREKLSYLVDSTAAPVAGISLFSTWIAYEVSMFAPQLPEVTRPDGSPFRSSDGFGVFVQTLPFRFYCVFTLSLALMTLLLRREFGPMLRAERRARHERKPVADDAQPMLGKGLAGGEPAPGTPRRGLNALLPLLAMIVVTVGMIHTTGSARLEAAERTLPWIERIPRILGEGESQNALLWGSIVAFAMSIALTLGQRLLSIRETTLAAARAAQSLFFALVILVLAWAIGDLCREDLGTAAYLTAAFHGACPPMLLPLILFGTAALISFATGTSFGTMAILLPNVVVLAHTLGEKLPDLGGAGLMVVTIGAVLEGSIFGDHCSPISDTTVLSSVASGSDHLHHVRTQAPYALLAMLAAAVCGYLPTVLFGPAGWPAYWLLGLCAMAVVLRCCGGDPARVAGSSAAQAAQAQGPE
ncbi:MAG: Na+/H+ antiporter NhaC family protein [Planctomycetota bacterium]